MDRLSDLQEPVILRRARKRLRDGPSMIDHAELKDIEFQEGVGRELWENLEDRNRGAVSSIRWEEMRKLADYSDNRSTRTDARAIRRQRLREIKQQHDQAWEAARASELAQMLAAEKRNTPGIVPGRFADMDYTPRELNRVATIPAQPAAQPLASLPIVEPRVLIRRVFKRK